jgi:ABC-2 type transport system ATP-binding protein
MSDCVMRAEQLAWRYGAAGSGVHDVSLSLSRGAITGFLGRNGAGKSTTMRLLAGVLVPQAGTVTLDGAPMTSSRARARVGWAPEEPATVASLTVREHLRSASALARHQSVGRSVDDVIAVLDLGAVVDRLAGALSKGTRQRLGVAMALVGAPDVVLLDEPTAGLDPAQVLGLRALLRAERARGAAILLSSHVVLELSALVDDVVAIADGRTVFAGPVAAIDAATAAALSRSPQTPSATTPTSTETP